MKHHVQARVWSALFAAAVLGLFHPTAVRSEEGPDSPPIPHTETFDDYVALANSTLPQYTGGMLSVPEGPNWIQGVTLARLASSVSETMPDSVATQGSVTIGYGGPKWMKVDYSEGFIRYTNRDRCFQTSSPCTAIPAGSAQSALYNTLGVLGVPAGEAGDIGVDLVAERSVDDGGSQQESVCEVERLVTQERRVGGSYPIFDSVARMAVSNLYQRARLLIRWPQFRLDDGLIMRTRSDVVDEIAQKILVAQKDESGLGTPVDLRIRIGFMESGGGYVPAARVSFTDSWYREAGLIFEVPLASNPTGEVPPVDFKPELQLRARFDPAGAAALVEFYLPDAGATRLSIVDVAGREVAALADGHFDSGWRQTRWDLRDRAGIRAASGVYYAVLRFEGKQASKKLLVIR
jgi:hypothetical protein